MLLYNEVLGFLLNVFGINEVNLIAFSRSAT